MSTDPLDRRLDAYSKQPLPAAPADMTAGVWREIERRRGTISVSWDALLSPRLVLAGLAFALIASVVPTVVIVKRQSSQRLASDSLHFDAFSTRAAAQVVSGIAEPHGAHRN